MQFLPFTIEEWIFYMENYYDIGMFAANDIRNDEYQESIGKVAPKTQAKR